MRAAGHGRGRLLQFLGALVGETLSLAFRPSREFRVWIVERPGISEVEVSLGTLPPQPTILVLEPQGLVE